MRQYTMWAVQEAIGWREFEDIAVAFLAQHAEFAAIRQAGGVRDGGRDATILIDGRTDVVFAFSMEQAPLAAPRGKFHREYARWHDQAPRLFVFVTNQQAGAKKLELERALLDPPVRIYDITDLVRFLDLTPTGRAVKEQHGLAHPGGLPMPPTEATPGAADGTPPYTILTLRDVSHGGAKRYAADLLVDRSLDEAAMRGIVRAATAVLRRETYHRDEIAAARWAAQSADVVWLFVYPSLDDAANTNWRCRSQWVNPALDPTFRPAPARGDETLEGIAIDWNREQAERAAFNRALTATKADFLREVDVVLPPLAAFVGAAAALLTERDAGHLAENAYVAAMIAREPETAGLYDRAGRIGLPPTELRGLAGAFRLAVSAAHNVALPFSARGLALWPPQNRDYLVRAAVKEAVAALGTLTLERAQARG